MLTEVCKNCGHDIYAHSDIASYRMARDQRNFHWCAEVDCDCNLSLDSFDNGLSMYRVIDAD